jgi:acyl-coenzyme A synthetase/AMP-(fatty) acid ligase
MYIPLSQLCSSPRPQDSSVALRNNKLISFAQLKTDVAHNAQRLNKLSCRAGVLACHDSYKFAVGFLALCHVGAKIVMPSTMLPRSLAVVMADCDCLLVDQTSDAAKAFLIEEGGEATFLLEPFEAGKVDVSFWTSGSTGAPKQIVRTVEQLECEVNLVSQVLDSGSGELVSGTVSHQHVYGLMFRILWPLTCGRPFSARTHEVWETLLGELEQGGVLVTSPAHLSRLTGITADAEPKLILSAGAVLAHQAAQDAEEVFGLYPTEIFGSTETGACAIRQTRNSDDPWVPLPSIVFGLTPNQELQIQSPAVSMTSWVKTADIVDLLPDGRFSFKGRADRIVKIEGKRVSLPEVETGLAELQWVDIVAVLPIEERRNMLAAVVVCSDLGCEKLQELGEFRFSRLLRQELSLQLEPAGLPKLWRFVESLPTGDMGKREAASLTALFLEN